jgi:hypothetical protein
MDAELVRPPHRYLSMGFLHVSESFASRSQVADVRNFRRVLGLRRISILPNGPLFNELTGNMHRISQLRT